MNYEELEMAVLRKERGELSKTLADQDINTTAPNGENLLHAAVSRPEIVAELIESGIELDVQDGEGKTPLHRAVELEYWDVAELLLENGAAVNTLDVYGRPPLNDAIRHANLDCIEQLLERGADPRLSGDGGKSPLEMARDLEYEEIVDLLEGHTDA